jgi:hypothetical protein
MQPNRPHTRGVGNLSPHMRQRPRRVRFPGLGARDIAAVDVRRAERQPLLCVACRCPLEHTDKTLIERQCAT